MSTTLKDSEANIICGLGTYTHTVVLPTGTTQAMYFMKADCLETPASSISITLSQSGSTTASVTSTAPSAVQQLCSVQNTFNCQAGDVLTCAITSAAAIDNQLNGVKTTVAVMRKSG